jgi:outer membrane protein assembly factor BamB
MLLGRTLDKKLVAYSLAESRKLWELEDRGYYKLIPFGRFLLAMYVAPEDWKRTATSRRLVLIDRDGGGVSAFPTSQEAGFIGFDDIFSACGADSVLVSVGKESGTWLQLWDALELRMQWETKLAPVQVECSEDAIIVRGVDRVVAVDKATGHIKWEMFFDATGKDDVNDLGPRLNISDGHVLAISSTGDTWLFYDIDIRTGNVILKLHVPFSDDPYWFEGNYFYFDNEKEALRRIPEP